MREREKKISAIITRRLSISLNNGKRESSSRARASLVKVYQFNNKREKKLLK